MILQRDEWEIVECRRCAMVFLGSELDYSAQAENYDWLKEYSKEVARRKQTQPFMLFLSRLLRPLRPNTNRHMLAQTLRWKRSGKLVDFGSGDGGFLVLAARYFEVTGIELSPRGVQLSRAKIASRHDSGRSGDANNRSSLQRELLRCSNTIRLHRARMEPVSGPSQRVSGAEARRRHRPQNTQLCKLESPHPR